MTSRPRALLILAVLGLVLSGACATVPPAPDRDVVARGVAARPEALAPAAQRDFALPPGVDLGDGLSTDEAVATALWNNPEFQVALAALGIARADLIQAGMIRNPVLSLLFPWGPKQLEATVNLPVEAIWQRPRRIAEANLNARVVADRLIAAGLQLAGDVKVQFIDAVTAAKLAAIATEQSELARQISDLAAGRLRAGDISELDRTLAALDAARWEALRVSRLTAQNLGVSELRRLMGMPAQAPPLSLSSVNAPPPAACGTAPELIQAALASRPDVRAAELDVEAAAARAGVERSKIFTLTAILDMNAQGKEGFEAGPGLAAEVPLLSRNEAGRARAAAELDQAARRYLAVRARTSADVEAASIRFDQAIAVARVWSGDKTAALATGRAQAQRLLEAGEISLLDHLELRRRLNETELMRVEAESAASRERARLEQAVGRSCGAR